MDLLGTGLSHTVGHTMGYIPVIHSSHACTPGAHRHTNQSAKKWDETAIDNRYART